MLRNLQKPLYRWAFRQGDNITRKAIRRFTRKYTIKFMRKRRKMEIEVIEDQAIQDAADNLIRVLMDGADGTDVDDVHSDVVTYAKELLKVARTNEGLAHSKVREYWLYRGPRYSGMFLVFTVVCSVVQNFVNKPEVHQRMSQGIIWVLALGMYMFMLYFRLPDSIYAAVSRSTHDFYVSAKKKLKKQVPDQEGECGPLSPSGVIRGKHAQQRLPTEGGWAALPNESV